MRDLTVRDKPLTRWALSVTALAASLSVILSGCSTPASQIETSPSPASHPERPSVEPANEQGDPRAILVGHSRRWLTNGEGQVVILHGLNMVYKAPPYEPASVGFGAAAAATLADDGFDVVRLGVIYSAVEPEPGVFSGTYLNSIAGTVDELARRGVYSLLDFHQDQMSVGFGGEGFPEWSVDTGGLPERRYVFPLGYTTSASLGAAYDNFWSDVPGPGGVGLQQRYAAAWRFVAERFVNDAWVVGYDLFNEPWPAHASGAQLGAFYKLVIGAIRSVDRVHLIFYEPYALFDFGAPTTLPPLSDSDLSDSDLGMSFHDYCLHQATAPATCDQAERNVLANALARSASTGDALLMSEFGATDDLPDLGRLVVDADADQMSWIEWAYCGCGDPTGTIPPSIEGLVADPQIAGTGSNVDEPKLALLAEPYPRVVSGTPQSYSFDLASHTFTFRYTTSSPAGRAFSPGSCTAVVIPPFQFPHGYAVSVTGATVTSKVDAGALTLSQVGPSVHQVTVEISAGSGASTAAPEPAALTRCT
jgi:endoglycosylceramidase